eukprot:CAMPEP_0172411778 /NCGR_PEP_ID=MMETSP1061-20121228/77567_1 /TAXON_ID=37318 /ORGANISM="Pseudo-nitzschia pungens, Strain cf. pungens" /LENGTH=469 /DNA_ID=CAMNT_0013147993 /DNA_START=141 /DNA_END=1550 /DNA_ORIENTATION=-
MSNSTSKPGAFFVPNPLGAPTATAPATATATAQAYDMDPPIRVQTERIVVAEVAPGQENSGGETGNAQNADQRTTLLWILAAASAVIVLVIVVFLMVRRQEPVPSTSTSTPQQQQQQQPQQSERRASIIDVLSPFVVSNPDVFDPDSPEASSDRIKALEWLVATDPMQIEPTSEENIHKLRQRFVLALVYYSTKGEYWDEKYWYLSRFDECTWNSVRSTAQEEDFWMHHNGVGFEAKGNLCNEDGWLTDLSIYWNNLAGTLPPEISYFKKSLKKFTLGGGALQGTIPESYGEFETLESVLFFDNCLTGMIPDGLTKIPTLEIFSMYSNPGLYGSLNSFCNHSVYRDGVVVIVGDNCNTNETTDYGVDCDCCSCCDPNNYWCVDPIWGGFQIEYTDMTDDGYVKNFQKPCMSDEQKAWVDENCPCLIMMPGVGHNHQCTTNCSAVDAIPIKTYWSSSDNSNSNNDDERFF